LSGVGLPSCRHRPGLERLGLLVEARDAALVHHGDPEIAGLVGLRDRACRRDSRLEHRQRIFRDLAGLGIDLAEELFAEMREPDMPSASTIASCGWICFRGRSYSVMTTRVARPVGRGQRLERIVPDLVR
jgi:hypothetical protein